MKAKLTEEEVRAAGYKQWNAIIQVCRDCGKIDIDPAEHFPMWKELKAFVDKAREDALEEAAKIAENDYCDSDHKNCHEPNETIAAAIRALREKK